MSVTIWNFVEDTWASFLVAEMDDITEVSSGKDSSYSVRPPHTSLQIFLTADFLWLIDMNGWVGSCQIPELKPRPLTTHEVIATETLEDLQVVDLYEELCVYRGQPDEGEQDKTVTFLPTILDMWYTGCGQPIGFDCQLLHEPGPNVSIQRFRIHLERCPASEASSSETGTARPSRFDINSQSPGFLPSCLHSPPPHYRLVGGNLLRIWGAQGGPLFNYELPIGAKGISRDALVRVKFAGLPLPKVNIGRNSSFCPVSGRLCYYTNSPLQSVLQIHIVDLFFPA